MGDMIIEGNIVDVTRREIFHGKLRIESGHIIRRERIGECEVEGLDYIMPGFIDSHVHIESSMLTPANFGEMVMRCGTIAVVTDPHEIANVMGTEGVEYMVESAKSSPIHTFFTIPSSVPATPFDRSGGVITAADVESLAASDRFVALSEMMNVPGVINHDHEVMGKIAAAKRHDLRIDGHAPLLKGEQLQCYASQGISTDHECSTIEEAMAKIECGMKIQIREGSAAKNYEALRSIIEIEPRSTLFCTDDSHPDQILSEGHIDKIVRRAVEDGYDLFDTLWIATTAPKEHYSLAMGGMEEGDVAEFIVVNNLTDFITDRVYINGELRYDRASAPTQLKVVESAPINNFNHSPITADQLKRGCTTEPIKIIGIIPNELITTLAEYTPCVASESFESDTSEDVVKIVYINRYFDSPPIVEYCRGFGVKRGAFASSIAHDSHNIIAVGVDDKEIAAAVNSIIACKGGLSVVVDGECHTLPLPIAGIISDRPGDEVAERYGRLQRMIGQLGCTIESPFMTLSFLSLVVIPFVKIGEEGLFSYEDFAFMK